MTAVMSTGTGTQPPRFVLPNVATERRDRRVSCPLLARSPNPVAMPSGAQRHDERRDAVPRRRGTVQQPERVPRPRPRGDRARRADGGTGRAGEGGGHHPRPGRARRIRAPRRPTGRCRLSRSRTSRRPRAAAPRCRCRGVQPVRAGQELRRVDAERHDECQAARRRSRRARITAWPAAAAADVAGAVAASASVLTPAITAPSLPSPAGDVADQVSLVRSAPDSVAATRPRRSTTPGRRP